MGPDEAVFVHLSSESCDDYYFVFNGPLTDDEAVTKAKGICDEDNEYLYEEAIVRWPRDVSS